MRLTMRLTMRLLVMAVFVVGFFCTCGGCGGKLERTEAELRVCKETVADMEAVVKELKTRSHSFDTALVLLEKALGQCTSDGLTGQEKVECFNSAIYTVVIAFKDKEAAGTSTTPNAASSPKSGTAGDNSSCLRVACPPD